MNSIFNFTNVSGQIWEFTCKRLKLTARFNNVCKSNGNELCLLTCDNCSQARTPIPNLHKTSQSSSIPTTLPSGHPSSQSSSVPTAIPSAPIGTLPHFSSNVTPSTYCIDNMNSIFNFTNDSGQTWEFTCKRLSIVKQNLKLTVWFNNICKSNGNELCPLTCDNCSQARITIPNVHKTSQSSFIPTTLLSRHPSSQSSSVPTAIPSASPNTLPIFAPTSLPTSFPITRTRLSNYVPSSQPLWN